VNVSIIIPAYNAAQTISNTLESVLGQGFPNWEAIVIDDGSTDATPGIVKEFAERDVRFRLITQPNAGEAGARNAGIAQARYDWLLFLDADDWISPLHLERMTTELRSNTDLDAVHCGSARVAPDGTLIVEKYSPPVGDLFSVLARRAAFNLHACVVRRSLVETVGRFDTTLERLPDWDLWQRIARTGARFGAVREVLAFYRMRPNSLSLDAYLLLKAGLRVLRRGHSPDPRVPKPHPDHRNGLSSDGVRVEEFYFLSWCAGLMLGSGKDARPLLEMVKDDNCPQLYPEAIAQCIFEAALLPTCQPPQAWEKCWPDLQRRVEEFLMALEKQSMAPELASHTMRSLKRMVLNSSPVWSLVAEAIEELKAPLEEARSNWQRLAEERRELQDHVRQRTAERDELAYSYERQLGDLLLNGMRLRRPVLAVGQARAETLHRLSLGRLAAERHVLGVRGKRHRVVATVCDVFPIYSQTFVYQELTQLARTGFELRLIYSKLDSCDYLHPHFAILWKGKRRLFLNNRIHERDFARYRERMPDKVESLIQKLCAASAMAREDLILHGNFLQAFSFTRMVEAYRPQYLHSYFFYDRSLMALVAGYLLNIPRGISCYADHLLKDYELKVVPLHLELCDIVIATSERVKRELLEIAPHADPNRVLVKPNGIATECFPVMQRREPAEGEPFRLVSVCRIEPKKGLIDMVEAVSLLRQRGMNLEAHIVGTVDEWSQASRDYKRILDQKITELDLWGKVHLEGRQNLEGVRRFLGLAHLFVAPFVETEAGDKDGIPTALLEGMATGLPVVATNAGSITEVIDNGRHGALVFQRDPVALANAIERLLRDRERRQRLGREAADKMRRCFDVKISETVFHERLRAVSATPLNVEGRIDEGERMSVGFHSTPGT
jgi:glycosyltransferase involved in cell wall biosynthesis